MLPCQTASQWERMILLVWDMRRDLKAENVLLRLDGTWVVADFGSASRAAGVIEGAAAIMRAEDDIRRATTPAYRAPEMWDLYSKECIDYRVDLWVRLRLDLRHPQAG